MSRVRHPNRKKRSSRMKTTISKDVLVKKSPTKNAPRILALGRGAEDAIRLCGADAVIMSYTDQRACEAAAHENLHGLLLMGGVDVSPTLYSGDGKHTKSQWHDETRDLVEMMAIEAAVERGIPILGICRGAQIMNATLGGTLHQHIPDVEGAHRYHGSGSHRIRILPQSRLAKAMRKKESWVTSIHHQAVNKIAPGFVASAWAMDGIIEAIESVAGWMVGVQYHPEMALDRPGSIGIFSDFVRAAARSAGLKVPDRINEIPNSWIKKSTAVTVIHTPKREPIVKDGFGFQPSLAADLGNLDGGTTSISEHLRRKSTEGLITRWCCFRCHIDFDEREDHKDHMWFLHDVDIFGEYGGSKFIDAEVIEPETEEEALVPVRKEGTD